MAKSNAILNIIFGADTKQLDRALGGVAKRLRETADNLNGLGQNLSLGLTAPIAAFAGLATKSFVDSAKAIAQVEAAVKSTGGAAGRSVDQLSTLAEGLQRVSLFDDDDILQNVTANLLTFTSVTGQEFDRAQQAILDYATRTGTDLTSATLQFGKALNAPIKGVTALGRAGVQFTAQQKEQIETLVEAGNVTAAQAVILGELETQFGGAAAAAANADPYTQLAIEIGALAEEFGGIINDALKPLLALIRDVVDEVKGWSDETKTLAVVVGGLLAAIGPTLIAVSGMINAFVTIKGAMRLARIEQLKLNASVLANPYVIAAAAVVALGIAIYTFTRRAETAVQKIDKLRDSVKGLAASESILEINQAIDEQGKKVEELRNLYNTLRGGPSKEQLLKELKAAEETLEGYKKLRAQKESDAYWSQRRTAEIEAQAEAEREAAAEAERVAAEAKQRRKEAEAAAKAYLTQLDDRLAAIDAEYKITGDLNNRVTSQAAAYRDAAIAAQLLGNETEALALKQEMLNRVVAPEVLTPINPNADTGPVTNTGGPIVSNATTEAINAQIEALTGLGTAYDNAQQKGLNFAAAIEDAIEQAAESIVFNLAAMAGAALSSGDGMQGAGRMIIATLADLAIQVGQIAIGVGITIDGIQKALVNLNPYVALAAGIALVALGSFAKSELAKAARSQSTGGSGPSLGVPAFAQGGLVTGPMLAMVGDNPSGKEAIIPFERMGEFMKMMGGGQSAQQVVVTGRISGRDLILSNERTIYDRTRTKG
jgi:hypothetical protein